MTNTLKNFYHYQKSRFPIVILTLSMLPATLSSAAIVIGRPSPWQVIGALTISILYLLHIRITDEMRDFQHDNQHHRLRPIQAGVISPAELLLIDNLGVFIALVVAFLGNIYAFLTLLFMMLYTYFSGQDFFISKRIRQHFFIYNGVNLLQMLLLQLFVYIYLAGLFKLQSLVFFHYLFTTTGTIIFEFVRKLRIPGEDGTGQDTYTFYLGFEKALVIFGGLTLLNSYFFYLIMNLISENQIWPFISILLAIFLLLVTYFHKLKKTVMTEQIMQLAFVLIYAGFNLSIYFTGRFS